MLTANQTYYTVDNLTSEAALQKLKEGNDRYVLDHVEHPHEGSQRRVDLSIAQHPFAIILGCADSRVVPELIFDQGVGDLFVLRVAGNIADDAVIASIEFAVEHLGTRLVVVMGHERCGAVMAAINHAFSEGKLTSLINYIEPAIKAGQQIKGDCVVSDTVKAHANLMVEMIQSTAPILSHEVENGKLKVVPAYYRLATGKVEFLDMPYSALRSSPNQENF
ncbi:carbonic anhydrase [Phormidium tenue]|jgi:carbonic anhydrase|uniref:Carbonic anhydrase n=1 Tax=Phormidium tenue FACHB-1050 TaxID=2692857 RepID=A0ABR8CA64_9CYAN|nr:carbonic anhydrase [Phormidium tenue]MBD2317574.1 carbonic anhydrase [Phormidium tenue FACHB-1050]